MFSDDLQGAYAGRLRKMTLKVIYPCRDIAIIEQSAGIGPDCRIIMLCAVVSITIRFGGIAAFDILVAEFLLLDSQSPFSVISHVAKLPTVST